MKLRREFADLLISFALPPLIWYLFLAWKPGLLIENHDGATQIYLQTRDLFVHGGNWTRTLYHLGIQGGARLHETLGTLPFLGFLAKLGLTPDWGLNLLMFAIQGSFSYLVLKSATDLNELLEAKIFTYDGRLQEGGLSTRISVSILTSFSPIIAWYLPYGHEGYILGSLVFLVMSSLALAVFANSLTVMQTVISFLVLLNAIRGPGQQAILYGLIFGAPILLGVIWDVRAFHSKKAFKRRLRSTVTVSFIGLSAFLVALPAYWGMLGNAMGADSARSSASRITYSYYTSQWIDWIQIFSWTIHAIPQTLARALYHEVNYSLGPVVLLAIAFPWKKTKALGWGLIISLTLALLFSTNTYPISNLLLTLIPPLQIFRVPARAVFPGLLTCIVMASATLLSSNPWRKNSGKGYALQALAIFLAVGLVLIPGFDPGHGMLRESLAWIIAGYIYFDVKTPSSPAFIHPNYRRPAAAILLAGLGMHAFQERLLPRIPIPQMEENMSKIRKEIFHQDPQLSSPLVRAVLEFNLEPWGPNTSWALGISSIDGYIQTNQRFHDLVDALRGNRDTTGTMMNYHFGDTATFQLLAPLYNVKYRIAAEPEHRKILLKPTNLGLGPAWFPSIVESSASYADLAKNLRFWNGRQAWYIETDPAITKEMIALLKGSSLGDCSKARVLGATANDPLGPVQVETDSSSLCVLTVAMNFVSTLQATRAGENLRVFPVYGALTGILVPPGRHQLIEIEDQPRIPRFAKWAQFLGLAMLSGVFLELLFRQRSFSLGSK